MRLFGLVFALLCVSVFVVSIGTYYDSRPVPPRAVDQTIPVDSSWYANLPVSPKAATDAYIERIPVAMREKGERYSDTRLIAFLLRVANLLAATILLCALRLGVYLRLLAEKLSRRTLVTDATVAVGYFVALFVLMLPGEIYAGFVRPHLFGFSEQRFGAWLLDKSISSALFTAFYVVGVLVFYRFIRSRPSQWVLWAVGVYFVLRAAYALLMPGFIEPLTNDFRPLSEGPQKQQVLALARAAGVANVEVVTSNASQQTRIPDAHVSGLGGWARISVDDNTLDSSSGAMLRAVVGHELGHYVLRHEEWGVLSDTALMALGFVFVALLTRLALQRWGPRLGVSGIGDIAGLPLFWCAFLLWGFVSLPMTNAISRVYEHQADLYSLQVAREPHGLAEFMIHSSDDVRLKPTALEYALFYTHPTDSERVQTAMEWRAAHHTR
jgi:STE24 endopeptidase